MEIKSEIIFRGSTWYNIREGYTEKIFSTFWGVFKTCLAIGILFDKQLENEENANEEDKVHLPRSMFNRYGSQMKFYFKTAILTTECVNINEKDRLYLAFSEDVSIDELDDESIEILKDGVSEEALQFDKILFLRKFANYGAEKMLECLSNNVTETMENLMIFLNDSYEIKTEELMRFLDVKDLEDDIIYD